MGVLLVVVFPVLFVILVELVEGLGKGGVVEFVRLPSVELVPLNFVSLPYV